jgi:hypothetical protein
MEFLSGNWKYLVLPTACIVTKTTHRWRQKIPPPPSSIFAGLFIGRSSSVYIYIYTYKHFRVSCTGEKLGHTGIYCPMWWGCQWWSRRMRKEAAAAYVYVKKLQKLSYETFRLRSVVWQWGFSTEKKWHSQTTGHRDTRTGHITTDNYWTQWLQCLEWTQRDYKICWYKVYFSISYSFTVSQHSQWAKASSLSTQTHHTR